MARKDYVTDVEAKKDLEHRAIKYIYEAMERRPNSTEREMRREVRRRLKQDGYGVGWFFVIIKILMAILPLLFQRPKA